MPAMRGQDEPITLLQDPVLGLLLDAEPRCAGHEKNELIVLLIVPVARGSCLARRDNTLDAHARLLEQTIDDLFRERAMRQTVT